MHGACIHLKRERRPQKTEFLITVLLSDGRVGLLKLSKGASAAQDTSSFKSASDSGLLLKLPADYKNGLVKGGQGRVLNAERPASKESKQKCVPTNQQDVTPPKDNKMNQTNRASPQAIYQPKYLEKPTNSSSSGFTPIYDPDPKEPTVSVNAGDPKLYVGGGTINLAFAKAFERVGVNNCSLFTALHLRVFDKLVDKTKLMKMKLGQENSFGVSSWHSTSMFPSVTSCFGRLPSEPLRGTKGSRCGLVLIDIMDRNSRPFNNNNNVGMVYVVGPKGTDYDKDHGGPDFLHDVRVTGRNLIETLNEYNERKGSFAGIAANGTVDRIERVRICLISGGAFIHEDVTASEVARSLLEGIGSAYSEVLTPHIEFAFSEGAFKENQGVFERGVKNQPAKQDKSEFSRWNDHFQSQVN